MYSKKRIECQENFSCFKKKIPFYLFQADKNNHNNNKNNSFGKMEEEIWNWYNFVFTILTSGYYDTVSIKMKNTVSVCHCHMIDVCNEISAKFFPYSICKDASSFRWDFIGTITVVVLVVREFVFDKRHTDQSKNA